MRSLRRLVAPALLACLVAIGSACWIRGTFDVVIIVEDIGEEVTEIIDTVFSDSTAAVCLGADYGFFECTYIVEGDILCSSLYLISEWGLAGVLVDPLVLQVPAGVTGASGTFDDGTGPAPLVVTQTGSFPVEPGVSVTAEPGQTFLIIELPLDVAASLPEGPPDVAGTDLDFTFTFRVPGDQPLTVKGMGTVRLDVAGQTFYVPMLPCTTDFADVPAIQIPAPVQHFDPLPAIVAAFDPSMACNAAARDYSGLDLDLDHRLLYKAAPAAKSGAQVTLEDGFGSASFEVLKTAALGTPADRDALYPGAPANPEHLTAYKLKASGGPKATKRRLRTANRYGVQTVDLTKADELLLPAAASQAGPVPPLADPEVDAFACYRAKAAKGEPGLAKGTHAYVTDAHGSAVYDLVKPSRLCRPVDVDGQSPGAEAHPGELLCFKAKPSRKVCQNAVALACRSDADCAGAPCIKQPKPGAVPGIHVADVLGAQVVGAVKPVEVCVPSTTAPAPKQRARASQGIGRRASAAIGRLFPRGDATDPCKPETPPGT
jgi:hypothetical protein